MDTRSLDFKIGIIIDLWGAHEGFSRGDLKSSKRLANMLVNAAAVKCSAWDLAQRFPRL